MKTYNTYQEAKIDNPAMDILVSNVGKFHAVKESPTSHFANGWKLCNPDGHCVTVEQFLSAGYKFVEGDVILRHDGKVLTMDEDISWNDWNILEDGDDGRYILRAAALEKPKRVKVEYVKVNLPSAGVARLMIDGHVFYSYDGSEVFSWDGFKFVNSLDDTRAIPVVGAYYRRVEIEISERDEFIEKACEITDWNIKKTMGMLFDSGKFKLVEGE